MSRDHRKLTAFQKADALVIAIYGATRHFPKDERFGLTSQLRRAAVSVPANIVEGCARLSQKEYLHFLNIAFGSLREVGYFIDLAHRLEYIEDSCHDELARTYEQTARVLAGLVKAHQ